MHQRLYRYLFWTGYIAVLTATFFPLGSGLNEIHIGRITFRFRLDLLLHLLVYFLICMYYLFGLKKGITIFNKNPLVKFVLLILFLATVTEVIQLWVPDREFNLADWVANAAGLGIGVAIIKLSKVYVLSGRNDVL